MRGWLRTSAMWSRTVAVFASLHNKELVRPPTYGRMETFISRRLMRPSSSFHGSLPHCNISIFLLLAQDSLALFSHSKPSKPVKHALSSIVGHTSPGIATRSKRAASTSTPMDHIYFTRRTKPSGAMSTDLLSSTRTGTRCLPKMASASSRCRSAYRH